MFEYEGKTEEVPACCCDSDVKAEEACCCGSDGQAGETACCGEGDGGIKVLGVGRTSCHEQYEHAKAADRAMGLNIEGTNYKKSILPRGKVYKVKKGAQTQALQGGPKKPDLLTKVKS